MHVQNSGKPGEEAPAIGSLRTNRLAARVRESDRPSSGPGQPTPARSRAVDRRCSGTLS